MPPATVHRSAATVPQHRKRACRPRRLAMCLAVRSAPSYGVSPLIITVTQMQIAHLFREGRLTNRPVACPT